MSILDKLPESRTDVRDAVSPAIDISGPEYVLNPSRFKYVLIIPMWEMEMQWAKYIDLLAYLTPLNCMMSAFTPDYQILLRRIPLDRIIPSEYFLDMSLLEQSGLNDIIYDMKSHNYTGGIFIQFETPVEWTYKKQYRFMVVLMNIVAGQENFYSEHSKHIYLYRRYFEKSYGNTDSWDTLILSRQLHTMPGLINIKNRYTNYYAHNPVMLTYENSKILIEVTHRFNEPYLHNTITEIEQYEEYIRNRYLKHTHRKTLIDTDFPHIHIQGHTSISYPKRYG